MLLRVEIPGVEGKDLDIQVTQDAVSIAGEHRYEKHSQSNSKVHSEFRYGKFARVIPLPTKVQNQKVKADLKDGILILTLPKLEQEQSKVFKVNLDQSQSATASMQAGNGNTQSNITSQQSLQTT
ncbi:Hsp20/alpha crystallin family protein [Nostoc sp. NMS4]|uniref:Hsp20/alpha crystallin family protein n=1 Tax=Nostoc sp. NMS4 TaxID=2815390 RepID=UPI0025D0EA1B|nr:Hsp20/alpha crystallin family protein [Nostoc sp. NMS4]